MSASQQSEPKQPLDPIVQLVSELPVGDLQLVQYASSKDWIVRRFVASKTMDAETLDLLAYDEEDCVRACVASSPYTSQKTLEYLILDPDALVRMAVAMNVQTPIVVLCRLRFDKNARVRQQLRENPSRPQNLFIPA